MKLLDTLSLSSQVVAAEPAEFGRFLRMAQEREVTDEQRERFKAQLEQRSGEVTIAEIVGVEVHDDGDAVVPIHGPMFKRVPGWIVMLMREFGIEVTSTLDVRDAIVELAADDRVRRIVLSVSSPGGGVHGLGELAASIRGAGKPTLTVTDDCMASAALLVGAQPSRRVAAPAAIVGSIGTLVMLVDDSQLWEEMGVRWILVKTGPHKGTGSIGQEITEEQLAPFQRVVDDMRDQFVDELVTAGVGPRDMVMGLATGEVWTGDDARFLGLVTEIAVDPWSAAAAETPTPPIPPAGSSPASQHPQQQKEPSMLTLKQLGELKDKHPEHASMIVDLATQGKDREEIESAIAETARAEEIAAKDSRISELEAELEAGADAQAKLETDLVAAKEALTDAEKERDEAIARAKAGKDWSSKGTQTHDAGTTGGDGEGNVLAKDLSDEGLKQRWASLTPAAQAEWINFRAFSFAQRHPEQCGLRESEG